MHRFACPASLRSRIAVLGSVAVARDILPSRQRDIDSLSCESNLDGESKRLNAEPPRNLYLRMAEEIPELIGEASRMRQAFLTQISEHAEQGQFLPRHACASSQDPLIAVKSPSVTLRIGQWNINNLCGVDGRTPQDVKLMLDTIAAWDADVVVLQEAPEGPAKANWPAPFNSVFRTEAMRDLEEGLRKLGYNVQLRTDIDFATLLCSRLELDEHETPVSVNLDGQHALRHAPNMFYEDRAALLANFKLKALATSGEVPLLSVYATHLHHLNGTVGTAGVREDEAIRLLQHWWQHVPSRSICGILATDFNQARRRDYSDREWAVIRAGLAKPWVRQPEDDGVADLLENARWICAYDSPSANRNFKGCGAPPLTHWTGTTVDYPYFCALGRSVEVQGVYLIHSKLSDHLPVVTDVAISL